MKEVQIDYTQFNKQQMQVIREGLEEGLDVSAYANPKYDEHQMSEIKWGLEDKLDTSVYANENISAEQMRKIRKQMLRERYAEKQAKKKQEEELSI